MESGKGIKLNDKAYFSTEVNYTLNQHWSFNLDANINGSGTPVKAINKGCIPKILVSLPRIPIPIFSKLD